MRLLSGNPGMYQHSIEQNTEGETTLQEPEHGEDTIARVKGQYCMLLHYSETTTVIHCTVCSSIYVAYRK